MPVIVAIIGALMSGLMMWMIWGNGIQVVNAWLDGRAGKAKEKRDAIAIADAREKAARAPLRSIADPRDAALVLLSKLALLRGDITAEQNVLLSRFVTTRFGFDGKPEHRTAWAAYTARSGGEAEIIVAELLPLFDETLPPEAVDDFFLMLDELAALHGGPTDAQTHLIVHLARKLGRPPEGN